MTGDEKHLRDEEAKALLLESTYSPSVQQSLACGKEWHRYLFILILGSLFLNVVFAFMILVVLNSESQNRDESPYAGLIYDTTNILSHHSVYGPATENETERAILWESLDGSSAQVAIDKLWAASKDLPPSPDFTWDKSKAVYSIRGFHSQHCLRKLHRWVSISYNNGTQLDHYEHIIHCLDTLLSDTHCFADDTLMKDTGGLWGEGQQRQCRDWNKLKAWADLHNACYSYVNETQGVSSEFDRYKWCPPGSPYVEKVRSFLGLPGDWDSRAPPEIDSVPAYWESF